MALINFNVQREKRGEDIANEIRYLEREVYSKIKKGRKKIGIGRCFCSCGFVQ